MCESETHDITNIMLPAFIYVVCKMVSDYTPLGYNVFVYVQPSYTMQEQKKLLITRYTIHDNNIVFVVVILL